MGKKDILPFREVYIARCKDFQTSVNAFANQKLRGVSLINADTMASKILRERFYLREGNKV